MQQKVVAHYRDGRIVKGLTSDFDPARPEFEVVNGAGEHTSVALDHLKAVFFVKDLAGDASYDEVKAFAPGAHHVGHRLELQMLDDERIVGASDSYHPDHGGFFLVPADPQSNNVRCFVMAAAVKRVSFV